MTNNPVTLVQKIRDALSRANDAKWDFARSQAHSDAPKTAPGDASYEDPEAVVQWNVTRAFQDLAILAEHLALPLFAQRIDQYNHKNLSQFGTVGYDERFDHTVAPHLERGEDLFNSLIALMGGAGEESGHAFAHILEGAAVLTLQRNRETLKEKDVRDVVHDFLRIAYPDTIINQRIPYPLKDYVPDFASEDASTLAEFKFIKTAKDIGGLCEELHGDMFGYSGEATWKSKFGVLYQVGAFWTQRQLHAHMKKLGRKHFPETGMPPDWTLILVTGSDAQRKMNRIAAKQRLNVAAETNHSRRPKAPLRGKESN
jgi:hypothetical protein